MAEYLPDIYQSFRKQQPVVASTLDRLAAAVDGAGPLDDRSQRLIKLGIAIGRGGEGAVRSSTRKALALGVSAEELRHAALLAITTAGFPMAIMASQWIDAVLDTD